jgi:uncharacterized membrane protein
MKHKVRGPLGWLSRQLGAKFGIGVITIVPFAATAWILYWIFTRIDDILQPVIKTIWGNTIPGAGFAATLILILLVGLIASNFIGRRLIRIGESVIPGLPIVQQLYTGIKQILESFSPSAGTSRMQTVIIEFPRKGMKAIGFVTSELSNESGKKLFCVYIPNSPNPTSGGFLQIVEEGEIMRTNISIQNAFKTIVSAGRVVPEEVYDTLFFHSKPTAGD